MSKLITFFLISFVLISIVGSIFQGGGGIVTTELTDAIDADDTTIPVISTANFLAIDYVVIGNEKMLYSSKDATNFYIAERGYQDTAAEAHDERDYVRTAVSSTLNSMAGYNIASITDAAGLWSAVTLPFAILKLIGNALWINWSFLGSDLAILSYIWICLGIGLIVTIALSLAGGRRVA